MWPFGLNGRIRAIRVIGHLLTDSPAAMQRAVAYGAGIGLAPLWQIRNLIERGEAETVLSEFKTAPIAIYAITPPAKVRLFVDSPAARLKSTPL